MTINKDATLKDVAKLAGVSLGTASKVINNIHTRDVSREKVEQAMKELNYKPNFIARSLKTNVTNTIGVIVSDISNPIASKIVTGIESVCRELNFSSMIYDTGMSKKVELEAINIFKNKMVDGILYTSHTMSKDVADSFKKNNIPTVLISTEYPDKYFQSTIIDNQKASMDAVEYLISKGHRNIAFLSGPLDDPNAGYPRFAGYSEALKKHDIPFDENKVVFDGYRMKDGYNAVKKLFNQIKIDEITAIFCASDEKAFGALRALAEENVSVPKQISIMGFDGIPLTDYSTPKITTIEQPLFELGAEGMKLLYGKITENKVSDSNTVILPHQLKEKESVKTKK